MNKSITISLVTALVLLFGLTPKSFADGYGNCQANYGGGYGQSCPTGTISIDKKIQNPQTSSLVDNLGPNEANFNPDQTVTFKVIVKNGSNVALTQVRVKDIFPDFLSFVSGDGKFDNNTKTVTIDTNLAANQSKTFTVKAKLASAGTLGNPGVTCLINQAVATTNDGQSARDTAQFCVQIAQVPSQMTKGGLKIFPTPQLTTTPATGAEAFSLLSLVPMGLLGSVLRRKSK